MTRISSRLPKWLGFSCLLWASIAAAGDERSKIDRPAIRYEVERGLNFGLSSGAWLVLAAPASPGGKTPFSAGQSVQFEVGYDIGQYVSVDAFLLLTANRAGSDYRGFSNGLASGDFLGLIPGLNARGYLYGFEDAQGVKRTWIYLRLGAGAVFTSPKELRPQLDILVTGGPGVQYFTRLRHFAVGLDATFNWYAATSSIGFAVTPNIKFAL